MPPIALEAFHDKQDKTRYTVHADGRFAETLSRYRAYYHEHYGANVEESDLLRELAWAFIDSDRGFQRYCRKAKRNGIAASARQGATAGNASSSRPTQKAQGSVFGEVDSK